MRVISYILLSHALLSGVRTRDTYADTLKCRRFYVKTFNSVTRDIRYTCQDDVEWEKTGGELCSEHRQTPHIIEFACTRAACYKVCCRSLECLQKASLPPFRPKKSPRKWAEREREWHNLVYLDEFIRYTVLVGIWSVLLYLLYHLILVRGRIARQWSDDQETVDPILVAMAEKPPMVMIRLGLEDTAGPPITGQHSLLAYCRLLTSSAYRAQLIADCSLVDPRLLRSRILRHDLRLIREAREADLLRWRIAHNRIRRKKRFVRIADRWVYVSSRMRRNGWLTRNYRFRQLETTHRYLEARKMHLQLATKSHFDTKFMDTFDQYDVAHLMNTCFRTTNKETCFRMFMVCFEAAGLGHGLYRVERPVGNVRHERVFDAMFWHGPYFYPWSPHELIRLFEDAKECFMRDHVCLQLTLPLVIIGELRGRYADLHRWLEIVGLPYRRKLLFLGSYLERGGRGEFEISSIEMLSFLAAMKIAYPRHVFMLRGSAETCFSLPPRFNVPMDAAVLASARQMCNSMPLSALIDGHYLAVPSGVSPHMLQDPVSINRLDRPMTSDSLPLFAKYMLFGQPSPTFKLFDYEKSTGRLRFGLQAVDEICRRHHIKSIIRTRNELSCNPMFHRNRRLVSLSSCPTPTSSGVAMLIDDALGWIFFKLRLQQTPIVIPARQVEVTVNDETADVVVVK